MQNSMRMLLRASTLALTLVGGIGLAVGQNARLAVPVGRKN